MFLWAQVLKTGLAIGVAAFFSHNKKWDFLDGELLHAGEKSPP